MTKVRSTLTKSDLDGIRVALNDAIQWRESLADAWARGTPENIDARHRAMRYEQLHVKIFGGPSAVAEQHAADKDAPSVSIFDLARRDA